VRSLVNSQSKRFYAPHLHWARGMLALQTDDAETALSHFKKMGRPASPGDHVISWQAFVHQQLGHWTTAKGLLGMVPPFYGSMAFRAPRAKHPAVQRLTMAQVAHTEQDMAVFFDLKQPDLPNRTAALVLDLVHLIRENNYHDAAHVALGFPQTALAEFPELETLFRPIMVLGGDQAQRQQELGCTAAFWGKVVNDPEFDPKLAVQLYPVLDAAGKHREAQKLVNQLLRWVQRQAKQNPQSWPAPRVNATLAKLHCWMADSQMIAGQRREAQRSIRQAEKLAPDHADVIGRRGLEASIQGDIETAIPRLTQALEAGCRYPEVYRALLADLEGDAEAAKATRRKFGQHFGDIAVETEVDMPVWVEALTYQNYGAMEQLVNSQTKPAPAVKALQIFLAAAVDQPSSSQKITLNQEQAVPQWDQLLQSTTPEAKVDILTVIYLVVQNHARRNKKGIAAMQSRYGQQISALIPEVPRAALADLMLLPLKKLSQERLEIAVTASLNRATQPGHQLAKAQLQLRRFSTESGFRPFIEKQLQQEPQNPLLLLAQATLYPSRSPQYQTFYDQGFDIARRLQDAEALQAYREEDWIQAQELTRRVVGSQIGALDDPSQLDLLDIFQRMAREAFGMDVPPELIAQMLPELEAQMGIEDEDDFEDDVDPLFFPPPPPGKGGKSSKKRKSFFDL